MDHVEKINGYSVTYRTKCKHLELRGFHNKPHYVCLKCGADVEFCDECQKVFTLLTLIKNNGVCGNCSNKPGSQPIQIFAPQVIQFPTLFSQLLETGLSQFLEEENASESDIPDLKLPTPTSEMRFEKEDEKVSDEEIEGDVKNILAEDSQKKLWLVEWEGDDSGTWEEYDTIKDSIVFKEYIYQQMRDREGLTIHPECQ